VILFASLTFVTGLVLVYVIAGRPWLKRQPWTGKFFDWIEPIEIKFWSKSETILWARWRQFLGLLGTVLAFIGTIDLTPFYAITPEKYQWMLPFAPLAITLSASLSEYLRRYTTKPLELVAVPDEGASPRVEKAMAAAEVAKDKAVTVVEVDAMVKKTETE
jgi:hypothetical protein